MMTITPPVLGKLTIPALPAAVPFMRRWLGGKLNGPRATVRDDVLLLACEVVTNSIRHSDSGDRGDVTITALAVDGAVRIEVVDAGSATKVPRMLDENTGAPNGRGLYLVDVVSGRWGIFADGAGRTVWFEVPIFERGAPDHSG